MEKVSNKKEMEIGNLIFGHSRGNYSIPRKWQNIFLDFLENNGFDNYGFYGEKQYFENDVFSIRPYYWGEDEDIIELPNFVYKPENIEIKWYKYPLRDSYINKEITYKKFKEILKECHKSINY